MLVAMRADGVETNFVDSIAPTRDFKRTLEKTIMKNVLD